MKDMVAFCKGEYDFDYPSGHVHVSVPQDIYVSKIQQPFIKLLQEANQAEENSRATTTINKYRNDMRLKNF